ncbi:MAG: hypothetical protein KGL39_12040 [Patescibacteria group bacterium]|nr:hypothetical protein [Patescibacteria group bacterium]
MIHEVINPRIAHSGHELSQKAEEALGDWAPLLITGILLLAGYKVLQAEIPSIETRLSNMLVPNGGLQPPPQVASQGGPPIQAYNPPTPSTTQNVTSAPVSGFLSLTNALSGGGAASGNPPSSSANGCASGSYRRSDGQVVTLAQITSGLHAANYPGPWDTGSQLDAYERASGPITSCDGSQTVIGYRVSGGQVYTIGQLQQILASDQTRSLSGCVLNDWRYFIDGVAPTYVAGPRANC